MSPLSPLVLGGAALLVSPALWAGFVDGTLPVDVALTRYLIAVGICWAMFSVVADFAAPSPGSAKPVAEKKPAEAPTEGGSERA